MKRHFSLISTTNALANPQSEKNSQMEEAPQSEKDVVDGGPT
jgi:hypothetical protein